MSQINIAAYDIPERVRSYDADMEIMHPNRAKMIALALDVLPFATDMPLRALDLGFGTGYFAEHLLLRYPAASLVALDAAAAMIDLASARLGELAKRVQFIVGDFKQLDRLIPADQGFDVIVSSYALHHLDAADKLTVLGAARQRLKPQGWLLNADLVVAEDRGIEQRIQQLRVEGIVRRASGKDERFLTPASTRECLDRLEALDGDQPLCLRQDLDILRTAGFGDASVFWLEHREAVCGGTAA